MTKTREDCLKSVDEGMKYLERLKNYLKEDTESKEFTAIFWHISAGMEKILSLYE